MKFQKFRLNRIKYLILILLSIVFLPSVKAIGPTSDFYVNDYANILSDETEQYIMNRSIALNNVDGTQIVVVTVPNLGGMAIEDYSIKLARSFGIGSEEKSNGLLLLIALEERELRIEVGTGLEGIIPDGKAGRFRDQYMIPYLKENNWDEGIKNGYDAFYKEIVELNNLNVDYSNPIENTEYDDDSLDSIAIFFNAFIGLLIGQIISSSKNKKRNTIIYLGIWGILFVVMNIYFISLIMFLILNLIFFTLGRLGIINIFRLSGGGFYTGGGSSRGGGFSGGGGSFRGGGASGRF